MRRLIPPALSVLAFLCLALPLAGKSHDSAKMLYDKGTDAEARQNYEQAFDYFKQAYNLKPKDLRYRTAFERTRFLAGASHVHRGQTLRDAGKLDEAVVEFQKAIETDPSSFVALQELKRTQQAIKDAQAPVPQAAAPTALRRRLDSAQGPVELAPISNVPITLKVTEKSNVIYETVGKLAGINVLFDPDYTPRQVHVELNNVTLQEALEIISFETKTFWRPVTPNTIFIAQDNPAKRKELEQNVIKTFYLSNLSQPTELQDVVNAMRTILEVSRIQQLPSQGAIVVRGTPDQVALAQKLVDDLDKAKPEVMIEIAVMQVSRDKSHTLGINPPTSITVQLQPNISTTGSTTSTTTTTSSTTSTTTNGISLNTLANLNATDFQVTIPAASATALMADNDTKVIQNPQIRALDGQKASLKIGERVPVATGSFQPGIGGVGINPLVNTQFQYLDVGVNIDITPRVHAGREISLKLSMDVSEVDSYVSIGGISQPVIGQRKIEHDIRLKDGEVSVLGGMMEDSKTKSLTGIPGLASIPILKYLFAQDTSDHSSNEVIFVLIPHIIRGPEFSHGSNEMLDVGTANALSLRLTNAKAPPPAPAPVGSPTSSVVPPVAPASAPMQPQAAMQTTTPQNFSLSSPTPSNPAVAGGGTFLFDPPTLNQPKGSTFTVNVMLSGGQNVYSVPVQLNYDPNKLEVVNVSNGGFLSQDGQIVTVAHREDTTTGTMQITASRPPGAGGVSGQGAVVTLTFMAKAPGQSALTITRGGARDPAMQPIAMSGAQAAITIQ
ncbi:MAG TPA: cohesin domain-containing protein [Terriglobales bacterium]|jgi:general secretion pathway protein D|nr:cohesin domain-containing protein [Terriglobales bacterium]